MELSRGGNCLKISKSGTHLSKEYGIASDYFCEVLHNFRREHYGYKLSENIEISDDFTIRDEKAIKRVFSGLLKLLIPNGSYDSKEIKIIIELAIEYRQRVNDWLHILAPGEFPKKRLGYVLKVHKIIIKLYTWSLVSLMLAEMLTYLGHKWICC